MKKKKTTKKKTTKKKNSKPYLKGVDEKYFLETIDKITRKLVYQFKFGYHEIEDMKQQATIFAIEGMKNYDTSRPLENFLWTHVRNRLFNYKRDNYQRPNKPCLTCPFFDKEYLKSSNQCTKYSDVAECSLLAGWEKKNTTKKNLLKPVDIDLIKDKAKTPDFNADSLKDKETLQYIDQHLSIKLRPVYLNFLAGQKVPKKDYLNLIQSIQKIIKNKEEGN